MKKLKLFLVANLLFIFLSFSVLFSQTWEIYEMDKKIINEEKEHSELMKNLEYLCDVIGPRLTGSKALKKANDWTAEKFKEYGCVNVHLESWKFGREWFRGPAEAKIVEPVEKPLIVAQMAWTPPTNGKVRGPVILVDAKKMEDLQAYKGKLKNKFVLLGKPVKIPVIPKEVRFRRPDTIKPLEPPKRRTPDIIKQYQRRIAFRDSLTALLHNEGVLAIIRDSGKEHGLLNMTGGGGQDPDRNPQPITTAFMIHEHYAQLVRMLNRGMNVTLEMNLQSSYGTEIVDAYNTVAEIRGTEKPDEIVILGAHLDSWDLAQGATDNGTGSMAVLEVARILNAVGAKPKRTIRFILFSGEEQGLLGSRAYVEAHKDEWDKISGCFVFDIGSGRIRGISLQGRERVVPIMQTIFAPFIYMGVIDVNLRYQGGTDHLSFDMVGIPGFAFYQDPLEYGKTHHSQTDTYGHVSEPDMIQAATVFASTVLKVANLPEMLPREK